VIPIPKESEAEKNEDLPWVKVHKNQDLTQFMKGGLGMGESF
jgi:hypothetical protein